MGQRLIASDLDGTSMLGRAGRGIAMASATPDAIAIADEVTATTTDFGVALVLEQLADG